MASANDQAFEHKAGASEYRVSPNSGEDADSEHLLIRMMPLLILFAIGAWRGIAGRTFLFILFSGIAAVGAAVLLLHKRKPPLRVRESSLIYGAEEWQWSEVTRIEIGTLNRVRILSVNRTLCTVGMTYTGMEAFLQDARSRKIPIYRDGEEYIGRIIDLFM
ncbi:MAG: hypothetical protein IJ060_02275 [Oscillospiraceae bacterium]|nr:hypothetical protein [Oscillospiraceae bacterium]